MPARSALTRPRPAGPRRRTAGAPRAPAPGPRRPRARGGARAHPESRRTRPRARAGTGWLVPPRSTRASRRRRAARSAAPGCARDRRGTTSPPSRSPRARRAGEGRSRIRRRRAHRRGSGAWPRSERPLHVHAVRQRDVHGLHFRIGEQLLVGPVRAWNAVRGRELLGALARAAAHGRHLHGWRAGNARQHLLVDVGGGEDSPPHRFAHALPEATLLRLDSESSVTASSSTMPVITNFVPALTLSRPRPLSIIAITIAPRIALLTLPRPPNRLVPPITQAAIE